ncbi:hypothetical protein QU874_28275, partial [Klebsiella pneumoniae]|uniref:hypothetical protein n=1 Tax=Klebsiella pneumoniae TaxID=573 RepID=UPI0038B77A83
ADRNRSHWSTSKTPSYTKSVSWQHHPPPFRYGVNGSPNLLALLNTGMRPDNNHLWFCFMSNHYKET